MEFRFHIDGSFSPATIPMERLAEYMKAVAQLLGETANVHFEQVTKGSVVMHARIDAPAEVRVRDRITDVRHQRSPREAARAFEVLDDLLRKDNATGRLLDETDAMVLPFPGKMRVMPTLFGPIRQDGTIDGQVIRVGGKDATIPVHLRDGAVVYTGLNASEDMARKIAHHLLGPTIRVHGTGSWQRQENGAWVLDSFKIADFEILDAAPLGDVVARLRSVRGSNWGEVPNPVIELLEERHGGGESH